MHYSKSLKFTLRVAIIRPKRSKPEKIIQWKKLSFMGPPKPEKIIVKKFLCPPPPSPHTGPLHETLNGATCTTATLHCVGIRDPNNSHDSCGVEIRGRNDNSWVPAFGSRNPWTQPYPLLTPRRYITVTVSITSVSTIIIGTVTVSINPLLTPRRNKIVHY
jgi:hypothetical protein